MSEFRQVYFRIQVLVGLVMETIYKKVEKYPNSRGNFLS
ncbi:hypothetical protein LEP1GSC188_3776 [Leptospira weilii serovar Topaz str. LT2116]|uniref:Uncharacterized protein n=1 Tax=Leptospira weilii serovar Topaz str. LT2116 TaxID=1088540 RepID=M3GVM2_9LEPT|nr:hypothetical protein LEP1GSC188_3776 [Leptospira weilii serovar Topaz str. LT2116]